MKKALVVGIDQYPVLPLDGCANDAIAMEELLSSEQCGFLVKRLLNDAATTAAITRELQWALKESDFSIFYFAGHGIQTDVATYLASSDMQDGMEGVDVDYLQKVVSRLGTEDQTAIFILDCCHSGAAPTLSSSAKIRSLAPDDLPAPRGRGRILIAACNSEQDANETISAAGVVHGKFTYHFLNAIRGYAANEQGMVSMSAAYDYVAWNFDGDKAQVPTFRGDHEGVVVLAKNVTPIGSWRPAASGGMLTRDQAVRFATELIDRTLVALQTASNESWQRQGYRAACQTYEPVRKWFIRTGQHQPELLSDATFYQLYKTSEQYGRQLGTLTPGTRLRQGIVEDSLGAGTFGTVFRVTDEAGTKCLKLYHANDLHDMPKVARFRRGYDAMRQMDHPAIVKVREFSEVPLGFFMDYIAGPNARQYVPGITSDPSQVMKLLLQVAETLQHAHTKEVIHRDVKPENILISIGEDGIANAYLSDFDLAWFSTATKVTKLAEGFGSQFYAAPEQMAKPNSPAARSEKVDIFSFGQLCFFFLIGRDPTPFSHEENIKVLTDELGRNWTDPHEARKLIDFYSAATRQEPTARPSSFRDICQLLAEVQLALDAHDEAYDAAFFLSCLKQTVSGVLSDAASPSAVSMRSRSGRTDLTVLVIKEGKDRLGIEVSFRPDGIYLEGMKSHDARVVVNQRVDTCLQPYHTENGVRRERGQGGGFETAVRIENLAKDRAGVLRSREIISKVVDVLEQI